MRVPLTIKAVFIFFLPLIFMQELHQIAHSVINAFLARLPDPKAAIAAYSIAFSFTSTLNGANMVSVFAGISFITDRASFWRLFRFFIITASLVFFALEFIALTPLSNMIFGQWMGAGTDIVKQARVAAAVMALWIYPIMIRNFCYALAMIHRRTILISYATIVRILALGVSLFVFSAWLNGAAVGAAALVASMTVEAVFMVIATRPFLPKMVQDSGAWTCYGDVWRFSWPLMITQCTENGVVLAINFFLGQLVDPGLALASFGVVYALARVILGPMRTLVQTTQSLVGSRDDLRIIFKFTAGLLIFFIGAIFIIFYTPVRIWVLSGVMGLTPELNRYVTPAGRLIVVLAVFWGFSALFRGILSAMRRTGAIAITAGLRLFVVGAVGSVAIFMPHLNGSVLGILAMSGAFMAEALMLGWRIMKHMKQHDPLFPRSQGIQFETSKLREKPQASQ